MKNKLLLFFCFLAFASFQCGTKTNHSFEDVFEMLSEEELITFIKKTLEPNLFSASNPSQNIKLLELEPCGITFQYEVLFLSGESMPQEIQISTEDLRIDKEGRIIYTQIVVSNCASEKDEEIQLRIKDENILIRNLEKDTRLKLNAAIQSLSDFCPANK